MPIKLQSSSGGSVTLDVPVTASNFNVTVPNASGTAMVSGNMPAFSAYLSSNQTPSSNVLTKISFDIEDFDKILQSDWFMPEEYKTMDIEAYCSGHCDSIEQQTRVFEELDEYKKRNMLDLLRWLKYFVDTCRANNILWGVGRGSSVASYVLFIIGVHKIDSIKYNLDWQEFLR